MSLFVCVCSIIVSVCVRVSILVVYLCVWVISEMLILSIFNN